MLPYEGNTTNLKQTNNPKYYYSIEKIEYDKPYTYRVVIFKNGNKCKQLKKYISPYIVHSEHFVQKHEALFFVQNIQEFELFSFEDYFYSCISDTEISEICCGYFELLEPYGPDRINFCHYETSIVSHVKFRITGNKENDKKRIIKTIYENYYKLFG